MIISRLLDSNCIRRGILTLLVLFFTTVTYAVPARPGQIRQLTLDDGTTVTARLIGDEFGHYWLADDGNAYMGVGDSYVPVDRQALHNSARSRRDMANRRRARRLAPGFGPNANRDYTGHKKGLIILVNFANKSFKQENNDSLFNVIANQEHFDTPPFNGSLYDYFYDQSRGQFLLNFDVVGPYTVSKDVSYYGTNDSKGNDKYPATMIIEALKLANDDVNYQDYDWDGDGIVEQVFVIYAGKGEADGGSTKTIWPHEFTLSESFLGGDGSGAQYLDGVLIDTYACGSELSGTGKITGPGIICHEFSHCLGYPDYYDTDYSGGQGMFEWDLMDSGAYNDNSYTPAGFTSYERWVAGWLEPIELTYSTTVSNMESLQNGGDAYVIYNNGHPDEFFLLENRQKTGWDAGIPGAGLLILHVDYDEAIWLNNQPNEDPDHQRMTWIAADNEYQYTMYNGTKYIITSGAEKDPFPYDSINAFNANTTPAAKFYNLNANGSYYLDSSVEDITQNSDGTVSFRFVGTTSGVGTISTKTNAVYDRWYDMNGRVIDRKPNASGIYINNGSKVLIK